MRTSCPLDCYDACSVIFENNRLIGDNAHPITKGFLCPSLNSFLSTPKIQKPSLNGVEIGMNEALEVLSTKLKEYQDTNSIYFKSQGNFAKLQNITKEFFARYGSDFTKGSLCDSAGEAGILAGRGENYLLTYDQIQKSEVVVLWGRNISYTNSHLMSVIKDKKLIVIDPVKTATAKQADIHLQITPRKDFELTMLFSRLAFSHIEEDEEYIDKYTDLYEDYIDFSRGYRVKKLFNIVDVEIEEMMQCLELFLTKKVVFLVGVGVQKYSHGDEVLRGIDSLAAMLNLFGKDGCGVSYLGNSSIGFRDPFSQAKNSIPISSVDFSKYNLSFIQGANPASQMPNSTRVREGLKRSKFSIYFGLYENETSKCCNLIIPAKSFLEKDDIRFSYGHEYIGRMPKLKETNFGISEYELTSYLIDSFGYEKLKTQEEYINDIIGSNSKEKDGYELSKSYDNIPYIDGFYTDNKKFIFIDEIEDEYDEEEGFWLLSAKSKQSINSQFKCDDLLHVPPSLGLKDGEKLTIYNKIGSCEYKVKVDDTLRDDSFLLYSGAKNLNMLTSHTPSNEGYGAIYQELKVKVKI
jgi:anaerobic selenocysteine-containing dehydrogenase